MQQNQRKYSLKYSFLGSIVLLLAFNSDPSSSYATSNIFILDNSGSMGCASDTKFSDKVDKVHPERCESSVKYPVDIGRLSIIEQIDQLSSSNSEVALIEMGGVTTTAPEELTKIKKETCLVRKAIELTKNITSFKDQINNKELIIPNHSGSTGTGKALDLAWKMVKDKQGERRLVIMTDGEPNCGVPVCDVVDGIDKEIKAAPNKFKILKEIRILYGAKPEELNEDKIKKNYNCKSVPLNKIATQVNFQKINISKKTNSNPPVTKNTNPWAINLFWLLLPFPFIFIFVIFKVSKFFSDIRQDTLIFILDASQGMSSEVDVIWDGLEKHIRKIDIAKMIIDKQIFADENKFIKIGLAVFGINYKPNSYFIKKPAFRQHLEIIRTLIKTFPEGEAPLADVLEKILKQEILERYSDDIPKEILREEILKEEIQKEIQREEKEKEKLKEEIEQKVNEEILQRNPHNISQEEIEQKVNEEIEQRYTGSISQKELEQKVEKRLKEEIQQRYSRKPIKKLISRLRKNSVPHIILLTSSYDTCDRSPILIINKLEEYINFVMYIIDYSEKDSSANSSLERFAKSSEKIRLFRYDEQDYFDVVVKTLDSSFNKKDKINNLNKSQGKLKFRIEKQHNIQKIWFSDTENQSNKRLQEHKSDTASSLNGEFTLEFDVGSYILYIKYLDSSGNETGNRIKTSGELQRLENKRNNRQKELVLLRTKIQELRLGLIYEASLPIRLQLKQQIQNEETEEKNLEKELTQIEQNIENSNSLSNEENYDRFVPFKIKENDITPVPIPKKDS
ncbi:MAG: vWA domain-containing protein [Nostoc sp. DcaGUA01]|nr:vWA domain-containing protein [Nostoc sp. DcaGUA01]